ncbi:MAG: DnaJ domain-containing protein [Syntrophaceae bacterium]|nr:DnaJ domain-containing protein [Syntrophaceae bacterium]
MKKNYYRVLGINQEADPARIKKAYRCAAKRYHPDLSPNHEERFKEVQVAYETLSDPKKKAVYDEQFLRPPVGHTRPSSSTDDTPFPFHLFDEREKLFIDFDDDWNNGLACLFGINRRDQRDFHIEVILTQEEAAIGGEIPIEIPYLKKCRRCHGTGRVGVLICGFCRGKGREEFKKAIVIKIPPDVKSGMVIKDWIY